MAASLHETVSALAAAIGALVWPNTSQKVVPAVLVGANPSDPAVIRSLPAAILIPGDTTWDGENQDLGKSQIQLFVFVSDQATSRGKWAVSGQAGLIAVTDQIRFNVGPFVGGSYGASTRIIGTSRFQRFKDSQDQPIWGQRIDVEVIRG